MDDSWQFAALVMDMPSDGNSGVKEEEVWMRGGRRNNGGALKLQY